MKEERANFINFFKQLKELDPSISREENYQRLCEAEAVWNKRHGSEAQIKQHLIKEAKKVFATNEAYAEYKKELLKRELQPLLEVALSDDGTITLAELQKIIANVKQAGILEDEVKEYLDSRGIFVRERVKKEPEGGVSGKGSDPALAMAEAKQILLRAEKVSLMISILPALFMSTPFFVNKLGLSSWLLFFLSLLCLAALYYQSAFSSVIQNTIRGALNKEQSMMARIAIALCAFIALGSISAWAAPFTIMFFPTLTLLTNKLYLEKHLEEYLQKEGISSASRIVALVKALAPVLVLTLVMLVTLALFPHR
jgi:cation transport ATPase